jgi:hypothetical protein
LEQTSVWNIVIHRCLIHSSVQLATIIIIIIPMVQAVTLFAERSYCELDVTRLARCSQSIRFDDGTGIRPHLWRMFHVSVREI